MLINPTSGLTERLFRGVFSVRASGKFLITSLLVLIGVTGTITAQAKTRNVIDTQDSAPIGKLFRAQGYQFQTLVKKTSGICVVSFVQREPGKQYHFLAQINPELDGVGLEMKAYQNKKLVAHSRTLWQYQTGQFAKDLVMDDLLDNAYVMASNTKVWAERIFPEKAMQKLSENTIVAGHAAARANRVFTSKSLIKQEKHATRVGKDLVVLQPSWSKKIIRVKQFMADYRKAKTHTKQETKIYRASQLRIRQMENIKV